MGDFNYQLYYALNSLVGLNQVVDFLIFFTAEYLDHIVLAGALLFFLTHRHYADKRRFVSYQQMRTRIKEVILISASFLSAWGIVMMLKEIFAIPRPYLYLENVNLLFPYGGFDSFPSGHAAFFASLAVAVYFHHKRLSYVLAFFALLIGVTRIISGVHLPYDILVGYALGGFLSWCIYKIYSKTFVFLRK